MKTTAIALALLATTQVMAASDSGTITHPTCEAVLSVGADGRFAASDGYALDREAYTNLLSNALSTKGYNVIVSHNYGDIHAFGQQGIEEAAKKSSLAVEFRIAAASSIYKNSKRSSCLGGMRLTDPTLNNVYSVTDSQGNDYSKFETFRPIYDADVMTPWSRHLSVRSQCQAIFNKLLNELPNCATKN